MSPRLPWLFAGPRRRTRWNRAELRNRGPGERGVEESERNLRLRRSWRSPPPARFDRQRAVAVPPGAPGFDRERPADVPEIHHLPDADPDDEAGGCRRNNPAGCVRRAGRGPPRKRGNAMTRAGRSDVSMRTEKLRVLHWPDARPEEFVRRAAASSRSSSRDSENTLKRVRQAVHSAEIDATHANRRACCRSRSRR